MSASVPHLAGRWRLIYCFGFIIFPRKQNKSNSKKKYTRMFLSSMEPIQLLAFGSTLVGVNGHGVK